MAEKSNSTNPILAAAKRVPAQMVFGGADLLNMALGIVTGKGLSGVTPKSPSETINQDIFGLSEPDLFSKQGMAELVMGMLSPSKIVGGATKGVSNIIRPGGAKDLNMYHSSDPRRFLRVLEKKEGLHSPSIAIAAGRGNGYSTSEDINLILNPNYKYFDPQMGGSQLANRDMFSTRAKGDSRIGLGQTDLRLTEGVLPSMEHSLAILLSPKFKSFENFEKSPLGAKAVREFDSKQHYTRVTELEKALEEAVVSLGIPADSLLHNPRDIKEAHDMLNLLRNASKEGNKSARDFIAKGLTLPSDYAELKIFDDVPVNANTVSGILLRNNSEKEFPQTIRHIREYLKDIPVETPENFVRAFPEQKQKYEDLAKKYLEKFVSDPPGDRFKTQDDLYNTIMTDPYLTSISYYDVMHHVTEKDYDGLSKIIMESIKRSDQFVSDVANMLTESSLK